MSAAAATNKDTPVQLVSTPLASVAQDEKQEEEKEETKDKEEFAIQTL